MPHRDLEIAMLSWTHRGILIGVVVCGWGGLLGGPPGAMGLDSDLRDIDTGHTAAIANCTTTTAPNERFSFSASDGQIRSVLDGRCLSSTCGDPTGSKCYPAQFTLCGSTPMWQYDGQRRFVAVNAGGGVDPVKACLDVEAGGVGPSVGVYRCDGGMAQEWEVGDGVIKTVAMPELGPRCLLNGVPPAPPSPAPPVGPFSLDRAGLEQTYHGIGAISGGGGTTRLLVDYPEEQQTQILDYMFKPNFGASLQMLKVEIGGDLLTTDGSESSHMHDNTTVDVTAGYEWWLMTEAKRRNPDIKLYGLPWAYPGWVATNPLTGAQNSSGTPFDYPAQTTQYILEWVKGANHTHGLDIDYLGIWNEAASDATYVKMLRGALDSAGFTNTLIVAQDGGAEICTALAADPGYAKAVAIIGLHYPSDFYDLSHCRALGKPIWASEESSSYDDLNGAACWARVTNSHYVYQGITSSIMWNILGGYYPGTSWYASSMLTANQPWSGWYGVRGAGGSGTQMPVVWATAHITQFTQVGWKYLKVGMGSGQLSKGGFYTTIADPNGTNFSLNVVKNSFDHAACTRPALPPSQEVVDPEEATFVLDPSMGAIIGLACWRSNFEQDPPTLFEQQPDVEVVDGRFTLSVHVGDYITVSTVRTAKRGGFVTPVPPSQPRTPMPITDTFDSTPPSQQPRLWSQMTGSFEARGDTANHTNTVLRQTATQIPVDGWRGKFDMIPATVVGMREWQDVSITVRVRLPSTPSPPDGGYFPTAPNACIATRVDWVVSSGVVLCVGLAGDWNLTYGGGSHATHVASGHLVTPPTPGRWYDFTLTTLTNHSSGSFDGTTLFTNHPIRDIDSGFAAMATNGYFATEFDNVNVTQVGEGWDPNPIPPAGCLPSPGAGGFVGHVLSARPCQPNGIVAPDQNFQLNPDWALVHVASQLCAQAVSGSAGSAVTLQPCNTTSALQRWQNDYSKIHHGAVPLVLEGLDVVLVGGGDGKVQTRPSGWAAPGDWATWTFFDSTGQLRNQRTPRDPQHPVQCLALCKWV
eukprot:m.363526 g.363526  ORF g.363526 m.363526 type:complete len:1033 (+) comp28068_c0_seq2:228-3326(+)